MLGPSYTPLVCHAAATPLFGARVAMVKYNNTCFRPACAVRCNSDFCSRTCRLLANTQLHAAAALKAKRVAKEYKAATKAKTASLLGVFAGMYSDGNPAQRVKLRGLLYDFMSYSKHVPRNNALAALSTGRYRGTRAVCRERNCSATLRTDDLPVCRACRSKRKYAELRCMHHGVLVHF